jgi:hypothetical protein
VDDQRTTAIGRKDSSAALNRRRTEMQSVKASTSPSGAGRSNGTGSRTDGSPPSAT